MKLRNIYLFSFLIIGFLFAFFYLFTYVSKDTAQERTRRNAVVVGKPQELGEKKTNYIRTIPFHVIEVSPTTLDTTEFKAENEPVPYYQMQGGQGGGGGGYGRDGKEKKLFRFYQSAFS